MVKQQYLKIKFFFFWDWGSTRREHEPNHMQLTMHDVDNMMLCCLLKGMMYCRVGESFGSCLHERSSTRSRRRPETERGLQIANTTVHRGTDHTSVSVWVFFLGRHTTDHTATASVTCLPCARTLATTRYRGRRAVWSLGLGRAQFFWNRELAHLSWQQLLLHPCQTLCQFCTSIRQKVGTSSS